MTTMRVVLDQLVEEGLLPPDSRATISSASGAADDALGNPWYVRVLVGIGAWIAALLLIVFLAGGLRIITTGQSAISVGLTLCAIAIALRRLSPASVFAVQLALALSMAGQALFGGGVGSLARGVAPTMLAVVVLEIALIAVYPDIVHRFLSAVVIVGALVSLLLEWQLPGAIHALVGLLAAGALALWEAESALAAARAERLCRPIGYGLVVGLLGVLCLGINDLVAIPHPWISGLLLMLVLLVLEYRIVSRFERRAAVAVAAWLIGGTVLVCLPALWTPGILAAVIVVELGFARGNRLLLGLGIVGLVLFLSAFYYQLELTLLVKSLVLLATGLLLLGLRVVAPKEELA
ncbi:MAG TPA: DUF4401 domain-containing protein [Roseiflexaceae bacterium]|nr:DUF4401 domain-containing protein [Roseiflexaceae bacterium]